MRVPVTVLPEITCLLQRRLGSRAEVAFARAVAEGQFDLEALESEDLPRTADLMATYVDAPIGFVDASIVATAERLEVAGILTTDRRHFGLIRPRHVPSLRLLP